MKVLTSSSISLVSNPESPESLISVSRDTLEDARSRGGEDEVEVRVYGFVELRAIVMMEVWEKEKAGNAL